MTTMTDHAQPQVIESPEWVPMPVPTCSIGDHEFCQAAQGAKNPLRDVIDYIRRNPQTCVTGEVAPACGADEIVTGMPWRTISSRVSTVSGA